MSKKKDNKKCSVRGCIKNRRYKSFCSLHYQKQLKKKRISLGLCPVCLELNSSLNENICDFCAADARERARSYYLKNRKAVLERSREYYYPRREKIKKRNRKLWLSKSLKERRLAARRRAVKHLYKLSPEEHEHLLKQQNYKCPISGLPVNIFSHIDHDHRCCPGEKSCGKCVRGILYGYINSSLGVFTNPEWLIKAYKYLKHRELQ